MVGHSLGQRLVVDHVALVAAAVHRARAAGVEAHERHVVHRRQVVAAVEVVHVPQAVVGVVVLPRQAVVGGVAGVGYRVVGVDEVAVEEAGACAAGAAVGVVGRAVATAVEDTHGVVHRGVVAAHEGGVRHAAADGQLGVRAAHLVAAAEEVAYAEVAAIAAEVGVGRQGAVVDHLGAVDVEEGQGRLRYRAAVVVAAEGCQYGAAVDVDGHGRRIVARGRRDAYERVLAAAEERVDEDVVVMLVGVVPQGVAVARNLGHAEVDVRGLDVGHRAAQFVAHRAVAVLHQGEVGAHVGVVVEGARGHHLLGRVVPVVDAAAEGILAVAHAGGLGAVGPCGGEGVIGVAVAVEAAAAAVDVVDMDGVVLVGVARANLYGGALVALHPAGDVVAAVDGIDRVGVVHQDVGVARDVGHLAAADDVALDDGGLRRAHLGAHVRRVHRDGGAQLLRGAIAVVHRGGDGGRRRAHRQVVAGEVGVPVVDARRACVHDIAIGGVAHAEVALCTVVDEEAHAVDGQVHRLCRRRGVVACGG